jgi:GAF domain-containing protein
VTGGAMNLKLLDVLSNLADDLIARLDADACAISRVIGDVLILVAERIPGGGTLQMGQGYLVPDFPQTAEVLRTGEPRSLTLDDLDVDESEAAVLRSHGFGALAMFTLELNDTVWGLVEVYRRERRAFSDADLSLAGELIRVD